nr:auxin-responsive protein SAUR61-like isoform X1 [Ipomoea batatas]
MESKEEKVAGIRQIVGLKGAFCQNAECYSWAFKGNDSSPKVAFSNYTEHFTLRIDRRLRSYSVHCDYDESCHSPDPPLMFPRCCWRRSRRSLGLITAAGLTIPCEIETFKLPPAVRGEPSERILQDEENLIAKLPSNIVFLLLPCMYFVNKASCSQPAVF